MHAIVVYVTMLHWVPIRCSPTLLVGSLWHFVTLFMCVVDVLLHNLYVNLHLSVMNIIKKCSPTENTLPQPRAYKQTPIYMYLCCIFIITMFMCTYTHHCMWSLFMYSEVLSMFCLPYILILYVWIEMS